MTWTWTLISVACNVLVTVASRDNYYSVRDFQFHQQTPEQYLYDSQYEPSAKVNKQMQNY